MLPSENSYPVKLRSSGDWELKHKHYFDSVAYRSLGATTVRDVNEKKHLQPYFKNLLAALGDNTVLNIAVFGKFGAGKTTVINSFLNQERHNPNIRPLSLSLATFTREAEHLKKPESQNEKDKLEGSVGPQEGEWVAIERNLVQQMLYGPSNVDLPDSKFRKIESGDATQQQRLFLLLCSIFVSVFVLWDPWHIVGLIPSVGFLTGIKLICTAIFMFCAIILLKHGITKFPRWFGSAKLGWGKSELAIKDSQSAFNEYLDEIIYFFSQKKYNLVVLEDIDRFNNLDIFEHLRELNQILNKSEALRRAYGVSDDEPAVKFIYAVKEDLFNNMSLKLPESADSKKDAKVSEQVVAEATTKFFDWTMTVLPKVSATNSADFLMEMFENPTTTFRDYLRSVSIYFDDVRVLENTINDFKLHSELQEHSDLDAIKMLTILLFKNGFPKEYQRFVKQEGSLSRIVRTRWLATEIIHRLQDEISELEKQKLALVSSTQNEILIRYKALLFGLGLSRDTLLETPDRKIRIENVGKMTFAQLRSFYLNVTKQEKSIQFETMVYGYSFYREASFKPKELIIHEPTFNSAEYFENYSENSILNELNSKIGQLKAQISRMSQETLPELIDDNRISVSDYLTEIDEAKEFLSFSVVNGYLDETVDDYLSYFSGTRISLKDRQLIRRLRSGDLLSFEEPIENVSNFVGDLVPSDLQKPSIELGALFTYIVPRKSLVPTNSKVIQAYESALKKLANEDPRIFSQHFDWLLDHIDRAYYITLLVDVTAALNNDWSKYLGGKIATFAVDLIERLPEKLISYCIETMSSLNNFVNENEWHLTSKFIAAHPSRTKAIFGHEHTMLNRLDSETQTDLKLIDYLIESNALACNESTVPVVLAALDNGQQLSLSYQLVETADDVKIKNWINEHFRDFVNAELALDYVSNESSASLITLMTHVGLQDELISKLLEQYSRADLRLSDIQLSETPTDQEKYVVQQIIETKHLAINWSNLRWLTIIKKAEWRNQALKILFSTSNHLVAFKQAEDQIDPAAIKELINAIPIEVTDANKEILKHSEQCDGLNQGDTVLNFLIDENLVVFSEALVDRVTTQEALLQLASHFLDVDRLKWNETQTKLFNKLNAESLLAVTTKDSDIWLSLFKIVVATLVKNHILQAGFSDQQRGELLETILFSADFQSAERTQLLNDIFKSYQSDSLQFQALARLIENNAITDAEVKKTMSLIRDPELSKIVVTQTGRTVHIKNSPERFTFVHALYQIGLVSEPRVLKIGNKDLSVKAQF